MHSHDGLRDSLTHLASPGLFYEELRREVARAQRSGEPITLVRFVLRAKTPEPSGPFSGECEIEVISFSRTLATLTRVEDICSRMGNLEFLVLLRGDNSVGLQLVERVALAWGADFANHAGPDFPCRVSLENSVLQHRFNETALEFLNRLDLEALEANNPL